MSSCLWSKKMICGSVLQTSRQKNNLSIVDGHNWVNVYDSINKHKSRLLVNVYAHIFLVDYSDTFTQVSRLEMIRFTYNYFCTTCLESAWNGFQISCLKDIIEEEIYVEQREGFFMYGKEDKFYWIHRAIYVIKHSQELRIV